MTVPFEKVKRRDNRERQEGEEANNERMRDREKKFMIW